MFYCVTLSSNTIIPKDTPDMPFIETDFRKRKPHPNYKMHYDVENEVISIARKYKSHIRYVKYFPTFVMFYSSLTHEERDRP